MDISAASFAFSALSQPVRLDVFRLLVNAGPEGLAAGDIADALAVRQNTMSANLAVLQRSGLIASERAGRSIIYRADMTAMSALIGFMLQDCCGGKPELCAPALQSVINQTLRNADNLEDAHKVLSGRILALANAQDILTRSNENEMQIADVIKAALLPHRTGEGRFVIDGPAATINGKQSVGLSLA